MDHVNILQDKLSQENTIEAQAEEFAEIIKKCKNLTNIMGPINILQNKIEKTK